MYQKILELRRKRGELAVEARGLLDKAEKEKRDLAEDELKRYGEIEAELDTSKIELVDLEKKYERQQRLQLVEAELAAPVAEPIAQRTAPGTVPGRAPAPPTETPTTEGRTTTAVATHASEFRDMGDFLFCLRFEPNSERMLEHIKRAFSMGIGGEGGVLVPEEFSSQLLAFKPEEVIVRPMARVIPPGSAPDSAITFPTLKQGAAGAMGGVSVVWTAEGDTMAETDAALEDTRLEPKEVTAYVTVTNKLLRNAPVAESIVTELLRKAIVTAEDYAFLRGDGVGRPFGIVVAPGRKRITRNTTSAIKYEDILAMQAGLLPDSWNACMWIGSITAMASVKDLKDSSGNRIYTDANLVKGFPATVDGIPIRFTGRTPVLGSEGDLMLVDLSYYLIKDGVGPLIGLTEHLEFKANKTVIKIVRSVDGQLWNRETLTLEDGSTTVGPVVILKA